jgi:DNA-binding NtrC family response regulator
LNVSRVLIVDDEPVVQQLFNAMYARDSSLKLMMASDAADALQLLKAKGPFACAMVDKNLPDRSGLELIADMKTLEPDTEAILMTAYASLDSAIRAIELGAFDYVVKPFDNLDSLKVKIRNAVNKSRLTRERRDIMRRLAESEERYRQLFEACADAVIVFDAETQRVQDANQRALELYGWKREELVGTPVSRLGSSRQAGARVDLKQDGSSLSVEAAVTSFRLFGRLTVIEVVRPVRSP